MTRPVYVLGTGLSHDGSAVLLKDGRVCVGIEKERVTRVKHDGGNDTAAISYCLDAEGISLADVDLVVQSANFDVPGRDRYRGQRLFAGTTHPRLVNISHHLAHAWSAAGTTPFDDCAIMVIDGCGSPYDQCTDLGDCATIVAPTDAWIGYEKDSLYHFDGHDVVPLIKDFSPARSPGDQASGLPITEHSIGGFYAAISNYVFGNMDDAGKLMGMAPYGRRRMGAREALSIREGRLTLNPDWRADLTRPAADYADFRAHFQYYADVARWAQDEVEHAVVELFRTRLAQFPTDRVCYTGGVALNAVANSRLLDENVVRELYLEPAAGDNGLALGCAFYGWMKVLGRERVRHQGGTCFGRNYARHDIAAALAAASDVWEIIELDEDVLVARAARLLAEGKTIGWFRDGSEFGPRALGHRSILAHPGKPGVGDHINADIKFREDFRPFAPAVLDDRAVDWFEAGRASPYMILVDRTRADKRALLDNVTHVDGTARVQTVDPDRDPLFHRLIAAFDDVTGIPILLNTSFNRRGQPIVETPAEAVALFAETALDILVLQDVLVIKR